MSGKKVLPNIFQYQSMLVVVTFRIQAEHYDAHVLFQQLLPFIQIPIWYPFEYGNNKQ